MKHKNIKFYYIITTLRLKIFSLIFKTSRLNDVLKIGPSNIFKKMSFQLVFLKTETFSVSFMPGGRLLKEQQRIRGF